ncbi:unnamed protein product, partial [Prorocentrum cordatum]
LKHGLGPPISLALLCRIRPPSCLSRTQRQMAPVADGITWESSQIPPTIRRPWRVFEEDLEDKLEDTEGETEAVLAITRERLASVQARGAPAAFAQLSQDLQRTFVEVSIVELAAFVSFQRQQVQSGGATGEEAAAAAWDTLDCEAKAEWVPEDPRAALALDARWAPLLADGPPQRGEAYAAAAGAEAPPGAGAPAAPLEAQAPKPTKLKSEPKEPPTKLKSEPREPAAAAPPPGPKPKVPEPSADAASASAAPCAGVREGDPPAPAEHQEPTDKAAGPAEGAVPVSGGHPEVGDSAVARPRRQSAGLASGASAAAAAVGGSDIASRTRRACSGRPGGAESAGAPAVRSRPQRGAAVAARTVRCAAAATNDDADDAAGDEFSGGAQRVGAKRQPLGQLAGGERLYPELDDLECCVCGGVEASDDNDLAMCEMCGKGYHAKCHDPPEKHFGNLSDKWFCGTCREAIATQRGLRLRVDDYTWVNFPPAPNGTPWPAKVLKLDFSTEQDPEPYWVQFFESVGHRKSTGIWVGDQHARPWAEGPAWHSIRDSSRKLAVRLAVEDGAAPIAGQAHQPRSHPPGAARAGEG